MAEVEMDNIGYDVDNEAPAKKSYLELQKIADAEEALLRVQTPWYQLVAALLVYYCFFAGFFASLLSINLEYGQASLWTFFCLWIFGVLTLATTVWLGMVERAKEGPEGEFDFDT